MRYAVVHRFISEFGEGRYPVASVVQGIDGLLYGSTTLTSRGLYGVVFRVALDGTGFRVLHAFAGGDMDGADPEGALIQLPDGTFYGTTARGGNSGCGGDGCGTVFQMNASGEVSVLYAFTESGDGARPLAPLFQANDGYMYSTTFGTDCGVPSGCGTVFRIDVGGTFATVYAFTGAEDGGRSRAAVIQAIDTRLYGTTLFGGTGSPGFGVAFRLTPP
jgi:uncharacterized repeat protein (TIGR03803 family)